MHPKKINPVPEEKCQAGEAWRTFYQSGNLSWIKPETITLDYVRGLAQTEWIGRILKATGFVPRQTVRVLEAGCGSGIYAISLALLGFSVDAFDYNKEAVVLAQQLAQNAETSAGRKLNLRVYQDNLLSIQAASQTYDLVFNQSVLEYFVTDGARHQAIAEMVRVTKHDGYVAAIVQHTGHPFNALWKSFGWPGYTHQPQVAILTPRSLQRAFQQTGLDAVTLDGIYPWHAFFYWPHWYKRWRWLNEGVYLLGKALNRFCPLPRSWRAALATQILAIGRKP